MLAARASFRPLLLRSHYSQTSALGRFRPSTFRSTPSTRPTTTATTRLSSSSSSSSSSGPGTSRWRVFARVVRYVRIPVLVASVYGLGYQQGIIEYARNPEEIQETLLRGVLADVGCTDPSDVHAVTDNNSMLLSPNLAVKRVARVGRKIKHAAKQLAREKQREAVMAIKSKLPDDITEEQLTLVLQQDEDFMLWTAAIQSLEGNWTYMEIDVQLPNAFVTDMCPKHIFITSTMLSMMQNDDEVALVLGHELSHMLLGHIAQRNILETILRTVEILLLSMDPTSGLLSLGVIGSLAALRTAFTAAHSREHEHEADELGIQLAAMACFDTLKAADVFRKMHELHVGSPSGQKQRLVTFADSHPPSDERYRRLVTLSETHNEEAYADTTCASVGSRLRKALSSAEES